MRRVLAVGVSLLVAAGWAQSGPNAAFSATQVFHATGPLPSYDVATINKPAPGAGPGNGPVFIRMGDGPPGGQTIRNYILNAYGVSTLSQDQLVGGPSWIGSEAYVIHGKASDEQRDAMQKMSPEDQLKQNRMMQQSLLADRFKLKVHFETRELPYFELVPAKGGLKIKAVPAPPPFVPPAPGQAPPAPPSPGAPLRPGMVMMSMRNGAMAMNAKAMQMGSLVNILRMNAEVNGRPIVDKTGFTGNFDLTDLTYAGSIGPGPMGPMGPGGPAPTPAAADVSAPSLFTAVEETLGVKLVPVKGPVEVIVIDSIEHPSEN